MSFTQYEPVRIRLQRSTLAVPATQPKMFEKAAACAADYIFLDLEDSVAPPDKATARENAVRALRDMDWRSGGKSICVRINGLDTQYMYRDVVDLVEQVGDRIDTLLVPKVGVPGDIYTVECLVSQIEQARGWKQPIGLEALIETTLGMANVEEIAQCSRRLEALHFGVADYAASCRARTVNIGGLHPDYPGDQWHASLQRMLVACRAYGLRAIDGPFGDLRDEEGYRQSALRVVTMGYDGKWAIHPSQIPMANEIMSPSAQQVEKARGMLTALAEAAERGQGAASLDGKMIDAATERMARNIVQLAEAIEARSGAH